MTDSPPPPPVLWVCPACRAALAPLDDGLLRCGRCAADYPLQDGVPILVENPETHLEEMRRAVRENPAWYDSDQILWHDCGPCRHHLRRRRSYIEGVLRKTPEGGPKAERLLDLGCGDGANTRWLASFAGETHGCDYNLLRLLRCAKRMGDRASLCLANVHRLPYPDAFFDAVFFNHVLEHIPDDERALRSAFRVLRPGGLLILGVPNEGAACWRLAYRLQPKLLRQSDHAHFYTAERAEELAREAGFVLRETRHTGWGPPHWTLDESLRRFRAVDSAFEFLGRRLAPKQAASLYLILSRPAESTPKKSSSLEVVLFEPSLRAEWEGLADRSPQAWLFHRRDFIDLANRSKGLRETSLVALKNGRMAGLLPLNRLERASSPIMGSLAFGCAGPALDPALGAKEGEAVCEALRDRARRLTIREGCRALEVSLPPLAPAQLANQTGASPLDDWGFAPCSTSSYILDLGPEEEQLFQGFRPAARQLVRKAEKEGVAIRPADRPGDLDAYYRLHRETYQRTGASPHPRAYFEGIFETLAPQGLARILAAERGGAVIAFANIAFYKEAALFWTGCGSQEALELGANYLLQWSAIRMARSEGAERYEMGEAFPGRRDGKLAGLNTFKSAFGGERRPYFKGRIDLAPQRRPSRARLALYYLKQAARSLKEKRN